MNKGDPLTYIPLECIQDIREKLLEHSTHLKNGCTVWEGPLNRYGYGRFRFSTKVFGRRRDTSTHRISYILNYGPIKDISLDIDHLCYNKKCMNPKHLELVTTEENSRRALQHYGAVRHIKPLEKYGCRKHGQKDGYIKSSEGKYKQWVCRICRRVKEKRKREKKQSKAV